MRKSLSVIMLLPSSVSAAVCMLVVLLYCQPTRAGDTLDFVPLHYPRPVTDTHFHLTAAGTHVDYWEYVLKSFPYGPGLTTTEVWVSAKGYFLLATYYKFKNGPPDISQVMSESFPVVAPYAANIDAPNDNFVRLSGFSEYPPDSSAMKSVNDFIQSQTHDYFVGTQMMVTEWHEVPLENHNHSTTNTFQGTLITDGINSYAVFIYECGGMEWGGGVIGWWAGRSPYGAMDSYSQDYYDWHYLSGDPDSNTIGCLYSSTYSAIVYKLTYYCGDQHTWHTCVNGQCVYKPRVNRCDGKDDCRDGSDEWDCGFHGTLEFVPLLSPRTLEVGDNTFSERISTEGPFLFGKESEFYVYVSNNGYFSLGDKPGYSTLPKTNGTSLLSVVAPYAADIKTTYNGAVQYTDFETYSPDGSEMRNVSDYIQSQTGDSFSGTRMMVAEWREVPQNNQEPSITNTFQGILITDGTDSYAVFIYECGGMEWGGGVIGWQASPTRYASHSFSGQPNSCAIGCLYTVPYSAIVYRLITHCGFNEHTCENGECVCESVVDVCDGVYNDCKDGSDEWGCHLGHGTLEFIALPSARTVKRGNNKHSHKISTRGLFPFGSETRNFSIYVSNNGYFSFGDKPGNTPNSIPTSRSGYVVAPYAANIEDTTHVGTVQFADFDAYVSSSSAMGNVSDFVQSQTGDSFSGTRMMVAEWREVPQKNRSTSITNTFQGILITDGISSYAVFIYECGGMEWGGGVIGWQASIWIHESHSISGRSDSNAIDCLYSSTYSAVIYKLGPLCDYTCADGQCLYEKLIHVCDGHEDCRDGSDEYGCEDLSYNLPGFVIGSLIVGFLFCCCVGVCCVVVLCHYICTHQLHRNL